MGFRVFLVLGQPNLMHIGIFSFVLGNLPPKFRSRLSSIHLVAIVNRNVLSQYGMDSVLRPFVDDLKKLVSMYMYSVRNVEFVQ